MMRAIPGHEEYVVFPYRGNYEDSADFCRKMGERCGVRVEMQVDNPDPISAFWKFFKQQAKGVPGQKNSWRAATQWTGPVNKFHDWIRLYARSESLSLGIAVEKTSGSLERVKELSLKLYSHMSDQKIVDDPTRRETGRYYYSVSLVRDWMLEDEGQWAEAAKWLKGQHSQLVKIAQQ